MKSSFFISYFYFFQSIIKKKDQGTIQRHEMSMISSWKLMLQAEMILEFRVISALVILKPGHLFDDVAAIFAELEINMIDMFDYHAHGDG